MPKIKPEHRKFETSEELGVYILDAYRDLRDGKIDLKDSVTLMNREVRIEVCAFPGCGTMHVSFS